MTDKQTFLDRLEAALLERELSQTDIRPYIERFDRFYDRMLLDERGGAKALEDIDSIADNIAAQVSERYDEINRLAERTMTVNLVRDEESNEPDTQRNDAAETLSVELPTEEPAPDAPTVEPDSTELFSVSETREAVVPVPQEESPEGSHLPEYVDEEPAPNSTVFWVLFAVSLPITLTLAAAVLVIFLAIWGGLAAVIVGSIAALIVVAAGGTALSLVGIIYGIIQLFSVVPVGLYEIGLGVTIAGAVMFVGILLYNFAVRLVPLLIRLAGRLFRYLYGQLKVLFNFLRRECAKL